MGNVLELQFDVPWMDQVYAAHVTCIRTQKAWSYLAASVMVDREIQKQHPFHSIGSYKYVRFHQSSLANNQ